MTWRVSILEGLFVSYDFQNERIGNEVQIGCHGTLNPIGIYLQKKNPIGIEKGGGPTSFFQN
jgi:hypothetical protein